MSWDPKIIGQQVLLEKLRNLGELPNALLLSGPRDTQKFRILRSFLQQRYTGSARHQDLVLVGDLWQEGMLEDWDVITRTSSFDQSHRQKAKKKSNTIGVEDVKSFLEHLFSSSSAEKFCLIRNADRMTMEAANALLKTLEEPPARTTFFLTVEHEAQLPETIVSRCQQYHSMLVPQQELQSFLEQEGTVTSERIPDLCMLAQGRSEYLLRCLADEDFYVAERQSFQEIARLLLSSDFFGQMQAAETIAAEGRTAAFLEKLIRFLRSVLVEQASAKAFGVGKQLPAEDLLRLLQAAEKARTSLHAAVNERLLLETLFLHIS